jgi:hypothetical protein
MAATAEQIERLRRMIAETTSDTYSDTTLAEYVERYPLLDERGQQPYTWLLNNPPTQQANPLWIETYDLAAAAADIWTEKAAALTSKFDFAADGASFARSQAYQQTIGQARYYAARRKPKAMRAHVWPTKSNEEPYPGNAPEERD